MKTGREMKKRTWNKNDEKMRNLSLSACVFSKKDDDGWQCFIWEF